MDSMPVAVARTVNNAGTSDSGPSSQIVPNPIEISDSTPTQVALPSEPLPDKSLPSEPLPDKPLPDKSLPGEPLPGTITYLAMKNAHPRDAHISFEEGPHIYTVMGDRGGYTSVTTFNHSHFSHFDAEKIVNGILNKREWHSDPTYKYYQMSKEDILASWARNGASASGAGSSMHADIEKYYNGMTVENTSIEFQYFKNFLADHPELIPYRTEWMVYYEDIKISGSIDMIYENPDGTLQIYDWKRCKDIQYENMYNKFSHTTCISHLPDTNFWHYSLQLNMYKTILEHKYGKKVTNLALVCLHPENQHKNYEIIQVPFMDTELAALLEYRKEQLSGR
jgi:hypothetical protein